MHMIKIIYRDVWVCPAWVMQIDIWHETAAASHLKTVMLIKSHSSANYLRLYILIYINGVTVLCGTTAVGWLKLSHFPIIFVFYNFIISILLCGCP